MLHHEPLPFPASNRQAHRRAAPRCPARRWRSGPRPRAPSARHLQISRLALGIDLQQLVKFEKTLTTYMDDRRLLDFTRLVEQAIATEHFVPVEYAFVDEAQDNSPLEMKAHQTLGHGYAARRQSSATQIRASTVSRVPPRSRSSTGTHRTARTTSSSGRATG